MKCRVCGAESGKYPLCRSCNEKKNQGLIIKCDKCNQWHYKDDPCPAKSQKSEDSYLYDARSTLLSQSEQAFFVAIQQVVPDGFRVFPQVNLASFIDRTDAARYRNELFRNIDFLITGADYSPKIAVEINDRSHLDKDRKERDEKVHHILEEAGVPLLTLWTAYGVKPDYIQKRISEILNAPVVRIHHFNEQSAEQLPTNQDTKDSALIDNKTDSKSPSKQKRGCYIATAVYSSYDCPQVWTLRRYRDDTLAKTWYGRLFIRIYYFVSPMLVKWFGNASWFKRLWKPKLDRLIGKLNRMGVENTPYSDS